jgi:hypothetical protein
MPYKKTQRSFMDFIFLSLRNNVAQVDYLLGFEYEFIYLEDYIRLLCFLYECGAIIGRNFKNNLNPLEKLLQIKYEIKPKCIHDWQDISEERLSKYKNEYGTEPNDFSDLIFSQEIYKIAKIKPEDAKSKSKLLTKRFVSKKIKLKESADFYNLPKTEKVETEIRKFILEGIGFGSRFSELTKEMNGKYWAFVDITSDNWSTLTSNFKYVNNSIEIITLNWQENTVKHLVELYTQDFYPELSEQLGFQNLSNKLNNQSYLPICELITYWWKIYRYIPLTEQRLKIKGKRFLEISNYSEPGSFKNDCLEIGISVSLQFCHSTSKIMEKYHISFPDACKLLEEKGYLIWAGNLPLYNMRGDKLWL